MEMNSESTSAGTLPDHDGETSFSFVSWLLSSSVLTMAILAVVSWMIYVSWSRPPERRQQVTTAETRGQLQQQRQRQQRPLSGASSGNSSSSRWLSASATAVLSNCQTLPPHVASGPEDTSKANASSIGGNNILTDGIVAFRHTKAAAILPTKTSKGADNGSPATTNVSEFNVDAVKVRKERARLLSRLLSSATTASPQKQPPQVLRGSTVVVTIPCEDVGCDRLKHILFILATYFNVFVLVKMPEKDAPSSPTTAMSQVLQQRDAMVAQLWAEPTSKEGGEHRLNETILPSHRIILTSSLAARVAFCRQMDPQRVQVIIDVEASVKTQLNRFGYPRVYCYNSSNDSISGLANALEWNIVESA